MPGNSLRQGPSQVAEHLPNDTCQTDPDLAAVVAAWPELPEAIKAGILAMVKAAWEVDQIEGQELSGARKVRFDRPEPQGIFPQTRESRSHVTGLVEH